MRYLLISFILFFLNSCKSLSTTKNLTGKEKVKEIINPYFSNTEIDYVYKAKIHFGKHGFGGVLIIKKIKEEVHRVVFITEFGIKIFDFEFLKDSFRVNYIIDKMNKKYVLSALKNDYQLLISQYNISEKQFVKKQKLIYSS